MDGGPKKRLAKLDLTAVIASKDTKKKADVMAYVLDHGTAAMQEGSTQTNAN